MEWRSLPGFPDYEVSEYGDIRRLTAARTRSSGHRPRGHDRGGYRTYKLATSNGKRTIRAHQAVLEAFVGPRPLGLQAAHTDGNRLNNHVSNLRWTTSAGNGRDKYRHGSNAGARNGRARLTDEQIEEVRSRYTGQHGEQSRLAREYNVSASAMRSILSGEHWMGSLSRRKGLETERELVKLHRKMGIPAERVPLSGASGYQDNGQDLDIYPDGADGAPLCCQVKRLKSVNGTKTVLGYLGDADALFIRYDAEPGQPVLPPTVVMPWSTYEKLIKRR